MPKDAKFFGVFFHADNEDYAYAQADFGLHWEHISAGAFSQVATQLSLKIEENAIFLTSVAVTPIIPLSHTNEGTYC